MAQRILILQGHPDATHRHFGHALADAYVEGARASGREVRVLNIAELEFPLLRSPAEWAGGDLPLALLPVQQSIAWCEHLVLCFPLWMGGMPALVKGLLEQVARPGFAVARAGSMGSANQLLRGRSARIVVTMGMPALVYRWYFRAHSLKALKRNILGMVGIAPIRQTLIGSVEAIGNEGRDAWLARLVKLGRAGH